MEIKMYDAVLLKDGRRTMIIEVFSPTDFLADIGSSPKDWDTIFVTLDMIDHIIERYGDK